MATKDAIDGSQNAVKRAETGKQDLEKEGADTPDVVKRSKTQRANSSIADTQETESTLRDSDFPQQNEVQPSTARDTINEIKPSSKELDAALALLKKPDDTSRFVGLALLKPVLEQDLCKTSSADLEENDALILRSWEAIPADFMDGLLKAKANDKTSKEEASELTGLAVAILHTFMRLLPSYHADARFLKRIPLLITNLSSTNSTTSAQIMDIIHSLAMTPQGAFIFLRSECESNETDQKPPCYLFVNMLLIDIRAIVPSLQETLNSEEYPAISLRLCRAFDLISSFIVYLIRSLDKMLDPESSELNHQAPMPVDLLLKLRTNISESMSLTIESLRDRYDASTAGAAGLHPDARSLNGNSSSKPLPIAWDTSNGMFSDSLVLAQLSCLSLWLRDEENEALRREAAGILDVLLALYGHCEQAKGLGDYIEMTMNESRIFRSAVLIALEGIVETVEGVEAFLHEDGWRLLADDLVEFSTQNEDFSQGIEIVRVLLAVLESGCTGPAKEEWMTLVGLATQILASSNADSSLEFGIAVSQLAVELLVRAPPNIRIKNTKAALKLLKRAEALSWKDHVNSGIEDGLEEVVEGLESLALGSESVP